VEEMYNYNVTGVKEHLAFTTTDRGLKQQKRKICHNDLPLFLYKIQVHWTALSR
jgi:hypothetical protein